jgi:hypothetical protein
LVGVPYTPSPLRICLENNWTRALQAWLTHHAPARADNGVLGSLLHCGQLKRDMLCDAASAECVQLLLGAKASPFASRPCTPNPLHQLCLRAKEGSSTLDAVVAVVRASTRDTTLSPWFRNLQLALSSKRVSRDVLRAVVLPMLRETPANVTDALQKLQQNHQKLTPGIRAALEGRFCTSTTQPTKRKRD